MKTEIKTKLLEMLEIQNGLNSKVCGDDYATQNIPFYRAAAVECAELYEHANYKWWKKSETYDEAQAHLEIVDIWHFLMSNIITNNSLKSVQEDLLPEITDFFTNVTDTAISTENKLKSIDNFMSSIYDSNSMSSVLAFTEMMQSFELSFDELYKWYIGKNALNYFRQAHGYKDGSYNKNGWIDNAGNKQEDNVILAEILKLDVSSFEAIYAKLGDHYPGSEIPEPGC